MTVSTRFQTRRAAVCAEPPRDTKMKVAPKTKSTTRTVTKRTRKAEEAPPEVASREVVPTSRAEAKAGTFMSLYLSSSSIYCLQDRHWRMVYAKYPPLEVLPNEYLPHLKEGARAPHFLYGWAFNRAWTLEVARRRRLTFDVDRSFRRHLGGCEIFNFGDVTEDHLNLPSLRKYLGELALRSVCAYIRRETHARFTLEQPVSDKWDRILVLWTNYDIRESYRRFQINATWADVEDFMDELMNEGLSSDSERSKAMWWWSFDNGLVSFEGLFF